MPFYSPTTDEGPLDFPRCPGCGETIWSEVGCVNCMTEPPPPCEHDWQDGEVCPSEVGHFTWHECRLPQGHQPPCVCTHCFTTTSEVPA